MDDLPGIIPAEPLPPVPPSSSFRKTLTRVVIGLLCLFAVMTVAALVQTVRRPKSPVLVIPTPTPIISARITGPPPENVRPRLALTDLAGHSLITSFANKLWQLDFTSTGPRKTLLLDVQARILDMALSPDSTRLAFTFSSDSVHSGLRILDLRDSSLTEFVGLGDGKNVRNPVWSSDNLYLSTWNSGKSDLLYDMTTKRQLLELTASGSGTLGPIVFVPTRPRISYVSSNHLYESDYAGSTPVQLIDNISPSLHYYSPDTRFIAFHNLLGQLVLYDRVNGSEQILSEANSSNQSFGQVVAFSPGSLIYLDLKKDSYNPSSDPNPLYTFSLIDKSVQPLLTDRTSPMSLGSPFEDNTFTQIMVHYHGFRIYSFSGTLISNCDITDLGYDSSSLYPGSPLSVWSPDGKYLLAAHSPQIANSSTCALTFPYDIDTPDQALWLK